MHPNKDLLYTLLISGSGRRCRLVTLKSQHTLGMPATAYHARDIMI